MLSSGDDQSIYAFRGARPELMKRLGDMAVLFRSEHCVMMFEKIEKEQGIPLNVAKEAGELSRDEKIKIAYKRAHDGTAIKADFFLIMNNPPRGLSREALCVDTGNYIEDFKAYYADNPEKLEKVCELEEMIAGCGDFSSGLSPETNTKGVSQTEGLFPHCKSMDEAGILEERRLMYVAMTWAKERMYMCTVGTQHGKRPSRFAAESCGKMCFIHDIKKLKRI